MTSSRVMRIGTRGSALALAQAGQVATQLSRITGNEVSLVQITTAGDSSAEPLDIMGGTGVFATALRDALLRRECDLAVHSLKDLPTAAHPGLEIGAVPPRGDVRDSLCARGRMSLRQLPAGSRIGTGSPRRAAQLRAIRSDVEVVEVRGNVDTRLRKVHDGELEAVVLAKAGLERLDRLDASTEDFDPLTFVPAPGQGALAIEHRSADADEAPAADLIRALRELDDPHTRAGVTAERALLAALEAGCSAPVGAWAHVVKNAAGASMLELTAVVICVDGSSAVRKSATGDVARAQELGRELAAQLLAEGAAGLMGDRVK